MAIWVKIDPAYPVHKFKSIPQLKIKRLDENENAFRFGFASLNEKELTQAIFILKNMFEKIRDNYT